MKLLCMAGANPVVTGDGVLHHSIVQHASTQCGCGSESECHATSRTRARCGRRRAVGSIDDGSIVE